MLRRLFGAYARREVEVAVVLVVACVSLCGLQYLGKPYHYPPLQTLDPEEKLELRATAANLVDSAPDGQLEWVTRTTFGARHRLVSEAYVWWAGNCILLYVLLPFAAALMLCGGRLGELSWLGLSTGGVIRHSWIYVILFLLVTPVVVMVSYGEEFRHTYPFLLTCHLSVQDWLLFEACYLTQFVCLEFFFRGFLLFTLERHIGRLAVFVMVVPYCMIHFGKPLPETLGAIVAGIVLGDLALRLRSIWGGVAIHCAVAITMDVLSLHHAGSLERLFSPQ